MDKASRTLPSLSASAGNGAVDAAAGLDSACAIGCWMIGADALLAGATDDEGAGKAAGVLLSGGFGCMAIRTRYTPAATMASNTIIATNQLPYDACFLFVLRFTMLPVSQ
jgi:hypothetical protein